MLFSFKTSTSKKLEKTRRTKDYRHPTHSDQTISLRFALFLIQRRLRDFTSSTILAMLGSLEEKTASFLDLQICQHVIKITP
ncbi:hypothetical protein HanRHA438_Chr06g0272151 [Helianthus annuus]|nr:hypothetical protein HanIR_Chr06g0282681 [Helianthus annuus]KAJ0912248.1 hypothetical protein HanRHA438_Chr06g0272151 [Helianthus annuus]